MPSGTKTVIKKDILNMKYERSSSSKYIHAKQLQKVNIHDQMEKENQKEARAAFIKNRTQLLINP